MVGPARKCIILQRTATALQPSEDTTASRLEQLKLHRLAGLLWDDDRASSNDAARHKVANPNLDDVAAPKLAVDGEVRQRAISQSALPVQPEANGPDLLRLGARFAPSLRPAFQGSALRRRGRIQNVPSLFSCGLDWPSGQTPGQAIERTAGCGQSKQSLGRPTSAQTGRSGEGQSPPDIVICAVGPNCDDGRGAPCQTAGLDEAESTALRGSLIAQNIGGYLPAMRHPNW